MVIRVAYRRRWFEVDKICSTDGDFSAILTEHTVMVWVIWNYGGDLRRVQTALVGVDKNYSKYRAFAAVLRNGTVEMWRFGNYGNSSSSLQTAWVGVDGIH